jgi:hypothetical protein
LPRRRGERAGRESEMAPALYNSSTFASKPLTRDFRASSSEAEGTSVGVLLGAAVLGVSCVGAGVEVGSLFSFLGLRFWVFAPAAVSSTAGVVAAFFAGVFAAGSFGNMTPDPALPCSACAGVAAFLDRACLAGVAVVELGPGDEGFDAMMYGVSLGRLLHARK